MTKESGHLGQPKYGKRGQTITTTVSEAVKAEDAREAKSLPTATVQKIINEVLATNPAFEGANLAFAKDTRDILIECCVEFITMLTSEANEIAEKDAKKTIACEHITKAIADLGYPDFVPELEKVAAEFKTQQAVSWVS